MDVSLFLHKPCKFRLRSGKEVYGVIWREQNSHPNEVMFASSGDYFRLKARNRRQLQAFTPDSIESELESMAIRLNRDELIAAEILDNL